MNFKSMGMGTKRPGSLGVMTSLAAGLFLIGALAILGGCEINKPEMPTFDTSLAIPLGVERIEVMDMVEDEEFLVVGGDSSLAFFIDGEPDTLAFDFQLSADIGSQNIQQGLGNFELPVADPMAYSFELATIWPAASGMVSQPAMVPPFPINVSSSGQDLPDIDSAVLESGGATITVTNGLPVPISADSGPDQLVLDLIDPGSGSSFATFTFPVIAAGAQSSQTADLAGVTLPGTLAVALAGGSPGSSGGIVNVSGTDAIDIAAVFENLVVSSATAVVGAQSFLTTFDTALPADYEITQAVISSGSVSLAMVNEMPVPCTALVVWPNLVDILDQPLSAVFNLAAGQSANQSIDFSGYVVMAGAQPLTSLSADVEIETPGSGGTPVTMSAGDGLNTDISGGTIVFESVTGVVPAYDVQLDTIEEQIDLPDELDGLQLTAAAMVLRLTNSAGLPGDLDLTLTGTSAAGNVRTMLVRESIVPADVRAPGVTRILLNEDNSTIIDFLNNMPETIALGGMVTVGGDGSIGTVHSNDYAVVSWEIDAPVEVIVDGSTISADPRLLDLDQDTREMIEGHALGASIQTEILNHLPVGVELSIIFSDSLATLDTDPLLTIGPLIVAAAEVDPITHTVVEAVVSRPVVELTEEQARIFGQPGLITVVEAVLPSTNGLPVRMMASDFLEIRGLVQMDIHVNDQW
jgi:hypothetical protein